MRRFLVSATLAGVLALVAFGVQSGYLAEMTGNVLAAGGPSDKCANVSSSAGKADTLAVCGAYTGTTNATVTVKVLAVTSGRITSVSITSDAGDGPSGTFPVNTTNGQVAGGAQIKGQTYTFDLSGKNNMVNNTYTFGEKASCYLKSKC
jgi:hypothetical protein